MINLHMNGVHAARAVTGTARGVAWCENVEGGIGHVHAGGIRSCTVYLVKSDGIVLVGHETSLNSSDLYKRGYDQAIGIGHITAGSRRGPSSWGRARRQPALGVAETRGGDPGVIDTSSLCCSS